MRGTIMVAASTVALLACSAPETASAPDWSEKIRETNEQLNRGNTGVVRQMFATNYVRHTTGGDLPEPLDAIEEFVPRLRAAFPDVNVEVQILASEGNRVAWLVKSRGTHQGDFMGIPASGRVVEWEEMIVTRFDENGLIAEEWGVSDLAGQLLLP